jgi:hypothetical protein
MDGVEMCLRDGKILVEWLEEWKKENSVHIGSNQ